MPPIVLYNTAALLLVFEENSFHFVVYLAVVNECIGFEIVLETAEVEVGRTYRTKLVVDDDGFGVE